MKGLRRGEMSPYRKRSIKLMDPTKAKCQLIENVGLLCSLAQVRTTTYKNLTPCIAFTGQEKIIQQLPPAADVCM